MYLPQMLLISYSLASNVSPPNAINQLFISLRWLRSPGVPYGHEGTTTQMYLPQLLLISYSLAYVGFAVPSLVGLRSA